MTPALDHLLARWRRDQSIAENVVVWRKIPARSAHMVDFPPGMDPHLLDALNQQGIARLYSHQLQSWQAVQAGRNVVITTGTASGKTLCYNLPILDGILKHPASCALYLFPTKALTQDQLENIGRLNLALQNSGASRVPAAVYDGDTPAGQRAAIRSQTRILLTNPDMLHVGILPHHTLWADFLSNLRYIVIDELHTYRGVFGSHVANVLRRLRRVAAFYGACPQFLLTSATIANPQELAENIIEAPVTVIDEDGSPLGEKHFLLYNPPIVNPELGLRRSAMSEAIRLIGDLLDYGIQTIVFGRSRRSVEIILRYLQEKRPGEINEYAAYRSGYLPSERRAIEQKLRNGDLKAVAATTALELGIDIGSLNAAILVGYPGTIAGTRQQTGRAGRREEASIALLVASSSPLDQFLAHHPEYLLERAPESARINADNTLILLQHLRCAAFELPFHSNDRFGNVPAELLQAYLDYLQQTGVIHFSRQQYYWMSEQYPSNNISLRSASAQPVVLQTRQGDHWKTIGEIDQNSAYWMVHPQAIYLHAGQSYLVEKLDIEHNIAYLKEDEPDYYTEPRQEISITRLSTQMQTPVQGGLKSCGEIMVTAQVNGFRKIAWNGQENLGESELDLPATQLRTVAYWITIDAQTVETLRSEGMWSNDANDYGPNWNAQRNRARQRDQYLCQMCYTPEQGRAHHVHHKTPFRFFDSYLKANELDNLITLCPACHQKAELSVRIRSGLAGLCYTLSQLAPLFVMCDSTDLGAHSDPQSPVTDGQPTIILYDQIPAGIGLSENLYQQHDELIQRAYEQVTTCACQDGCPACVGPTSAGGKGGKAETLALLSLLKNGTIVLPG